MMNRGNATRYRATCGLRRRGSAYVEYFIAAVAMTLAALWLYNAGDFQNVQGSLQGTLDTQMDQIRGPVR